MIGMIIYLWRRAIREGREEFQKEYPELHRLVTDDTLTDQQRTILTMQMLKRDNNRMAINIAYNDRLSYDHKQRLHGYIRENEEFINKKREELVRA